MNFETGHLYHIYNQGNNRQNIFFNSENYRFFLKKIGTHIIPFADILAWCLMPNHFHLMVHVNEIEVDERLIAKSGSDFKSPPDLHERKMSLNKSIGIMLASYTRAINKQQNWSGSLFRKETKAICLTLSNGISPASCLFSGITCINNLRSEKEYPNICFNYILNNPVKAGLVKKHEDWEFSSYFAVSGSRNDSLINSNRIKEFGLEVFEFGSDG
jgi:putative transposase